MKLFHAITIILLLLPPTPLLAKVSVFACEPEWASLAQEIGGDRVDVFAATHARQDPHHIRARPSLIARMRNADLLICSGAGLEVGWLPVLLQKAANPNVQPGSTGHLMAADYVPLLGIPEVIDRRHGDIHPEGNPHVHLNPNNITLVAKELTKRLQTVDAKQGNYYHSQHQAFAKKWQQAITRWKEAASSLAGKPVVVHHKSFTYLLDWLGMKEGGMLEPKPGIPPTTAHLETLLQSLRQSPAAMILRSAYDPEEGSLWLAEKTGIPAIKLPYTVGGSPETTDLFTLFDHSVALMTGTHHD